MNDSPFTRLWPTTLMRQSLPGHEAANPLLQNIIEDMQAQNQNLTTDYLSENFLVNPHPVVRWLKECLDKTTVDFLRNEGIDYEIKWTLQGWANVNRYGDYHDLHNHPHSYLSGTYYVAVPQPDAGRSGRNDLSPGAISFYDPRPQANMMAIKNDRQINPEHIVMPTPGDVLLWPSFLHHFVHPNLSQESRISISFNVVLKQTQDYLPT